MMLIVPVRTSSCLWELQKNPPKITTSIIQFVLVCNLQDSVRLGKAEIPSTFLFIAYLKSIKEELLMEKIIFFSLYMLKSISVTNTFIWIPVRSAEWFHCGLDPAPIYLCERQEYSHEFLVFTHYQPSKLFYTGCKL